MMEGQGHQGQHLSKGIFIRKGVFSNKKSRNGDTLGPVELNVGLYQGNQGDRREQDDQGEVSLIIFRMSHQDFRKGAYVGFFRHFVCVFVFLVVFVIVFVFVFVLVSSYDF